MEFSKESNLQKKIERIVQATYLVSNHLKDTEPLKWELRKEGINFLTSIRSLGQDEDGKDIPADLVIDALSLCAQDLTSYLSLAIISGLISRNNGTLIIHEIEILLAVFGQVVDENTAKAGFILSEEFFAGDPELARHLHKKINKGQNVNFISDIKSPKSQITNKQGSERLSSPKDKKEGRQTRIIALLKTQPNLTIKDFARVINDCSEKTIQRELGNLVEKGIVKKEGERRWSTYSLK